MRRHHEHEIEAGELRCHVRDMGFDTLVAWLAIDPDDLRSVLRGRRRLSRDRVIALRTDVDLRPFERHEARARVRASGTLTRAGCAKRP